jgi:hypothetical protein
VARWLIVTGLILVAAGIALLYAPWLFSWFGRLPGDLRFESGRSRIFIPLTSMLLISIVLSVLFNLFRR